jgi:hypothetical protein
MNTMSARTIISHRMFVAESSHNANGTATSRRPDRVLNSVAGHTAADRGVPPRYRAQSPRAVAARQMLSAAITLGL